MARRHKGRAISGIIVLDKPEGESSNRSLQNAKRLFNAAKAGHTGSLDPLATGVLPLCFGEATKISQFLLDSDKAYQCTIKLGIKTDSGDCQGNVISEKPITGLDINKIEAALEHFKGDISQVPPMYSALKHKGQPLYKLARQGKTVDRPPRQVTVYEILLESFNADELCLEIKCSKGTYIRSIADDLGDMLGLGAHIKQLRRISSGPFTLDHSHTPDELSRVMEQEGFNGLDKLLIAADVAVSQLPEVSLSKSTAEFVKQGQAVIVSHLPTHGLVRLYDEANFIGIGTILDDGRVAPKRLMIEA